jgi:hypothetical protein
MIFGIGLSKTGTWSLHRALEALGIASVHYPSPDLMVAGRHEEALRGFDAAMDISVSAVFENLDRAYPGSRFILTVREVEPWLRSVGSHVDRRDTPDYHAPGGARTLREWLYGASAFDRASYAHGFAAFHERVRRHFAGRPRDLLVMDICAGEGWERLCPFLGLPVPPVAFPHANASAALASRTIESKASTRLRDHAGNGETLGVAQRDVKLRDALRDRDLAGAPGESDDGSAAQFDGNLNVSP